MFNKLFAIKNMIKVIVIDDEGPARLRIKKLIKEQAPQLELLGEADCGSQAIDLIEALRPDAIFLDIQMPDMSGFEMLSQLSYQPMVIFTTAYTEYAIKAFESFSVDYLVKPLEVPRFEKAIEKLNKMSQKTAEPNLASIQAFFQQVKPAAKSFSLPIKKRDRIILVDFEDISHFKAEDKYVQVAMNDGATHLLNKTITQLEKELPEAFIRVHRSYIVNRTYIYEIQKHFKGKLSLKLKDKNGSTILTGETYSAKIKKLMGL